MVYTIGTWDNAMRLVLSDSITYPAMAEPPPPSTWKEDRPYGGPHYFNSSRIEGKPYLNETKIIALVFFGRRELVQILDCYLKVSWVTTMTSSSFVALSSSSY
jgi:hypothetical protein